MGGEGDRAAEGAVAALDPVVLRLGGVVEGPLTLDGQQAVVEGDGEVVALDPWQLDADQVGVLALGDVQRGGPDRGGVDGCALSLAVPAERVGERAVDLVAGALVLGGRRLGDNAVRVREAGFTCRVNPPYSDYRSLSRTSFTAIGEVVSHCLGG